MFNRKSFLALLVLCLVISLVSLGCTQGIDKTPPKGDDSQLIDEHWLDKPGEPSTKPATGDLMTVHFVDVGQGDCIFIQLPNGQHMLIDAGNNGDGEMIVDYLKSFGVDKIDFLIGTHPHADHIGGMDVVIRELDIGKIYMPRVTHTTRTFREVLEAIQAKGLKITPAKAGVEIVKTENLQAVIIAPHSAEYEKLNDYSAVVKLTFGDVSFMFTGDGEQTSEKEMVRSGYNLQSQVLKVGHHGSSTSTTREFLKAVKPEVAVICLGADNDYGHPHREVMESLSAVGVEVYRTDLDGTIIISTDGNIYTVGFLNQANNDVETRSLGQYVGSARSDKYHQPDCEHVSSIAEHNLVWFTDEHNARDAGYIPCAACGT